jgi:hypothetical protein
MGATQTPSSDEAAKGTGFATRTLQPPARLTHQ